MSLKTVLHVIDTPGPGGAETVMLNLARRLPQDKWRSIAVVPAHGWLHDHLLGAGIETRVIPSAGSFNFRYFYALHRTIREHRATLVHAHLFGPTIYSGIAGRTRGVPVVGTLHGTVDIATDERHARLKAWTLRHTVDRLVFVSDKLRMAFLEALPGIARATYVIANGIDTSVYRPVRDDSIRTELQIPRDAVLIGAVANARPAKALDDFLRMAALLKQRSDRFQFVIAGDAEGPVGEQLRTLQRDLNLSDTVRFIGFRDDIPQVMAGLDALVITSRSEGFSLAAIQALACGVPVISTRCGGPEEIIVHGESGLLVAVGNPEEAAAAVAWLIEHPETKARLVETGLTVVAERYSVDVQVKRYTDIYEGIIGR